jgi:hypothetical protein
MKASRSFVAVLAEVAVLILALAPLPLHAQGGGQRGGVGGPGGGMMAARALVEQGSVEFLVTRATDLELTADQTAQLTVIGAAWSAATKESRDRIRAVMPQPGQGMGGGGDRQAMMQRMQDLQPVLQQLREDDEKTLDEAMKLLTEPQQARAKQLLTERTERMRPRRGG